MWFDSMRQFLLHLEKQSTSSQSIDKLKDSLPNLHNLGAPFKDLAGRRENGWCLVWLADVAVLNVLVFQSESEISTKFQFQARGEDFMFQVL